MSGLRWSTRAVAAAGSSAILTLSLVSAAAAMGVVRQPSVAVLEPSPEQRVIATSREGRPIVATRYGDANAPVSIVVLGQMHGNERAGLRVIRELMKRNPGSGVAVWLIPSLNPDGAASGSRTNAHRVDLNRNFPHSWRSPGAGGDAGSGPVAASEPETRGMVRFLKAVHPQAVVSFHQPFGVVDISHPASAAAGRQLARWMGLGVSRVDCQGPCHGTLTGWVDARLGAVALTVELPAMVSDQQVSRSATAVLRLARSLSQ
jgi:protein MpaA